MMGLPDMLHKVRAIVVLIKLFEASTTRWSVSSLVGLIRRVVVYENIDVWIAFSKSTVKMNLKILV